MSDSDMDRTGHTQVNEDFTAFVDEVEPRLSYALTAAYGVEVGRESTADAMAYAWEHWPELQAMDNPSGYLYRVGQSAARRHRRRSPLFPPVPASGMPDVEPGLPDALGKLSRLQRTAVILLYALDWSEREAAELLGVDRSTVRRHRDRGLKKLRQALEVDGDGRP
ncbi:MAG: RNA polymerase sigma factor [Actinomycetota bacterium]